MSSGVPVRWASRYLPATSSSISRSQAPPNCAAAGLASPSAVPSATAPARMRPFKLTIISPLCSLVLAGRRRLHVRIVLQHFLERREAAIHLFAAIGDGVDVAELAVLDAESVHVRQAFGAAETQEHRDRTLRHVHDV